MVDTSVLIDYYRKTDKENSAWLRFVRTGYKFVISSITKYEIYSDATQNQLNFWNSVLQTTEVFPFDDAAVNTAIKLNTILKQKRKQIDLPDLFIAATAVANRLPIATLNKKHFERIDELKIID